MGLREPTGHQEIGRTSNEKLLVFEIELCDDASKYYCGQHTMTSTLLPLLMLQSLQIVKGSEGPGLQLSGRSHT